MNKKKLIAHVQRAMGPGATRRVAAAAVDAVLSSISELTQEEPVHLTGFGSFARKHHPSSRGYDITRGCVRERSPYSTLEFRASKGLLKATAKTLLPDEREAHQCEDQSLTV